MLHDLTGRGLVPAGPECRSYPAQFEIRTLSGSMVELTGYASTTERPYEMYDMYGAYEETVRAGAFGKTLSEGADVAYLANHEGLTMARSKAGTLRMAEDSTGLQTVATVNTARSDVRDLVLAIEDGAVDQMSFGFRVVRQEWSPDFTQRSMVELNLDRGDVSAVNFGANPNTSVGLQRAFRSRRPAEIHRMAVEVREDGTLSDATRGVLAHVLDLIAAADQSVDKAQPLLADLIGVPNPDIDPNDQPADDGRAAGLVLLQREAEAELLRRRKAS